MYKQVVIVHFNTPEITRAAVLSLKRTTPDCNITIFDNSDTRPFVKMDGVSIIDNTKGQIIDFKKFLDRYPDKQPVENDWGSAKHCYTIDRLFDYFPDGFVLMDSDVLVKKDISYFFNPDVVTVGEIYKYWKPHRKPRLLPYLCWINVPMCRKYNIRYFDDNRNFRLKNTQHPSMYDTGASFLEDCSDVGLTMRIIQLSHYIEHLGNASWRDKNWKRWLNEHKTLYDMEEVKTKTTQKSEQNDKYLVVIPYFAGGAQGREIEYSVAGWRRHFKEPYQIVIVGDYHPVIDTGDDITFIKCDRVPEQKPENYRPHIDFVKKFKAVRAKFPKSKGFIFVADDCYAVNNFDIYDVMVLKQNGDHLVVGGLTRAWEREKQKTIKLLKENGYPIRNFTTHLPTWIEWDKLEELWKRFDMENESYIFEDLYFNIYYQDRIPLQLHIDYDNYKCGVYRPNPRMNYIYDAFKKKIWIQNSVEGWIPALDKILANYYGV